MRSFLLLLRHVQSVDADHQYDQRVCGGLKPYWREKMISKLPALITLLAGSWITLASPVQAADLSGSWATDASACSKVFIKKDGVISFQQDSDQYGGGFIMEGNRVRGQMQNCTIKTRKEDGDVIHMIAACASDIMASNVQFSAKIIDDNTIARIFPGMPELSMKYSRCSM